MLGDSRFIKFYSWKIKQQVKASSKLYVIVVVYITGDMNQRLDYIPPIMFGIN